MATQPAQPPYASFGMFKTTTETFADSVVPTGPLDRRVLDGLSGADFAALMPALRFLGLIDDERKATQSYRDLVQTIKDRERFKPTLLELIQTKYQPIIGDVDLKHGTLSQLEKAFKDAGVSQGQMLTKTIRFYVKALQECGVQLSPHITKPRRGNGSKKPDGTTGRTRRTTPTPGKPAPPVSSSVPAGFGDLPIPGIQGAFIRYPNELTETDCALFEAMVTALRAYAKGRLGGKERKS
jgi:hypothetical protein